MNIILSEILNWKYYRYLVFFKGGENLNFLQIRDECVLGFLSLFWFFFCEYDLRTSLRWKWDYF